ncbi:hypothetical protein [Halorussus salinus]|uniref:hypothetical protein n=1 Tax=Halorussus salinus TaxID=1364935 RepID=UPI00192F21FA|nr:hypothetical protein [Halorussus salinus]
MRHRSTGDAERERHADSSSTSSPATSRVRQIREGAVGGFVATLVMTAYRLPISRSLPPTARFWATFVGDGDEEDYPGPAIVLHLLYGTVAGAVFGAAGALVGRDAPTADPDEEARREEVGLLAGVGYALALSWVGERVLLRGLLGMAPDRDESLVFHVGHAVYGLTLGTWVGSRVSHPEDG